MRTETDAYITEDRQPVQEPRYVAALSFDDADTDITWLTSHPDALDPGGVAAADRIDGCLLPISGQSQRIIPDKAQHTIGSITLRLLDVNQAISEKIKTKLDGGNGLRRKRVVLYKGHAGLTDWGDYSKRLTYLVDGISYRDGVYTLKCSDIQRTTKTRIFTRHQGVLTSSITATDTTIPVTIADAAGKFPTLAHDGLYSANPNQSVGYIQIDDEVIAHSGWTDSNCTHLNVIERGALNTRAVAHDNPAGTSSTDQNKKVEEYIYLEMPVPKMIYALLTGVLHGQGANLPDHWHLSVPTGYVKLADFTGIGDDLWDTAANTGRIARFIGLKETEGKEFIERQLLLWLGAFMPVGVDGAYGLRRLQSVQPYSPYSAYIDSEQIVSYTDLNHDLASVINNILIKWNWIDSLDRFTKITQLIDSDSVSKHGEADQRVLEFQGVFTGVHTDTDLDNYFRQIRDRYAAPPLRLKLTLLPEWDRLEVGDTVRVDCGSIHDYNAGGILSRVFEVQGVTTNWDSGLVTVDLFGGVEPASASALSASFVLSDAFYSATGTDLATVLTISSGAVTASGNLPAGTYYYLGDLTINSGVTVTVNGHVELRIRGGLTINGQIDGVGRGYAGGAASSNDYGNQGMPGATGHIGESRGIEGDHHAHLHLWNVHPIGRNYVAQLPPPVTSMNLINTDGSIIRGLPSSLTGSSGSAGGAAIVNGYIDNANGEDAPGGRANGGAGGASGAGLVIISRGGAFGLSGGIDLSGEAGTPGGTYYSSHALVTVHAGPGVGGNAGGLMWLIDGPASLPGRASITLNSGETPIPTVDYLLNAGHYLIKRDHSVAANPVYRQEDQRDTNLMLGYVPRALNGYIWLPEDEAQQAAGYDDRPPTWSEVQDDGGKPEDNANYTTATSQLTDDAALGQTADWQLVSGTGKPEDNANYITGTSQISDDANLSGIVNSRYDGAPLQSNPENVSIVVDNNAAQNSWFKVLSVRLPTSYDGFQFSGYYDWGSSGKRFISQARISISIRTGADAATVFEDIRSSSPDDTTVDSRINVQRVDNWDGTNTWEIYVYHGYWQSSRLRGVVQLSGYGVSETWINDYQTQADSLGDNTWTPPGTRVAITFNYQPGADITSQNTAAGIAGQGALATADSVGSAEIDAQSVQDAHIKDGETLTNIGLSTSTTGQRVVINETGDELEFYGQYLSEGVRLLGRIGVNAGDIDNVIGEFGDDSWSGEALSAKGAPAVSAKTVSSTRPAIQMRRADGSAPFLRFDVFGETASSTPSGDAGSLWVSNLQRVMRLADSDGIFRDILLARSSNLAQNGHVWLSNQLLICWGSDSRNSDAAYTLNFDLSFDTVFAVFANRVAAGQLSPIGPASVTTTGVTIDRDDGITGTQRVDYLVIGKKIFTA